MLFTTSRTLLVKWRAQLRKAEMLKALRLKQLFEFRFKYFVQYVIGLLFIFKQIRNR